MMAKLDAVTAQIFVAIAERHELCLISTDVSSDRKACNLNTSLNLSVYSVPL